MISIAIKFKLCQMVVWRTI